MHEYDCVNAKMFDVKDSTIEYATFQKTIYFLKKRSFLPYFVFLHIVLCSNEIE